MSVGSPTRIDPYSAPPDRVGEARRWLFAGLAALFVLIGVAIALSIVVPVLRGEAPSWQVGAEPWNWVLGLVGVFVAVWIIVTVVRLLVFAAGGSYDWRAYRHYRRHRFDDWWGSPDSAVALVRERYARGEISREQYDQIVRDLERPLAPQAPG